VYKCYPSVVTCLSELAETNVTAKALDKYFSSTKAVLLNSFMLDIHDAIAFFVVNYKKDNMCYCEVQSLFSGTHCGFGEVEDWWQTFSGEMMYSVCHQ